MNAANFGDYFDGFSPANTAPANAGVLLPGCSVADDFTHALGTATEGRIAAALAYRLNPTACSVPASGDAGRSQIQAANDSEAAPLTIKEPWRENRILSR